MNLFNTYSLALMAIVGATGASDMPSDAPSLVPSDAPSIVPSTAPSTIFDKLATYDSAIEECPIDLSTKVVTGDPGDVESLIIDIGPTTFCKTARPTDFVVTIQPAEEDQKRTKLFTLPYKQSDLVDIVTFKGMGGFKKQSVYFKSWSEFDTPGDFGIVVAIPPGPLREITVRTRDDDDETMTLKVRIVGGFPFLELLEVDRKKKAENAAFEVDADLSASIVPVTVDIKHPGKYNLKGDIETLKIMEGRFHQAGSEFYLEGNVADLTIEQSGIYKIDGSIDAGMATGSDTGTTKIITTSSSCGNILLDDPSSSTCVEDPTTTLPPVDSLGCTAFACRIEGHRDEEGECVETTACT